MVASSKQLPSGPPLRRAASSSSVVVATAAAKGARSGVVPKGPKRPAGAKAPVSSPKAGGSSAKAKAQSEVQSAGILILSLVLVGMTTASM